MKTYPLRELFSKLDDDFVLKVLNATCNEEDMKTFLFFLAEVAEAKGVRIIKGKVIKTKPCKKS